MTWCRVMPTRWCRIVTSRPAGAIPIASRPAATARRFAPAATPRGGALLIHGLTDSPYSMRALAEHLNAGGFLHAVAADAGTRHGAGRPDQRGVGGLERRGADGRATRPRSDRRRSPAGAGRLLQWRRTGHEVRARCARGRIAAVAGEADPVVADDWRVAGGAPGARDQRARSRSCRRRAGSTWSRNTTRSSTTRFRRTPGSRRRD